MKKLLTIIIAASFAFQPALAKNLKAKFGYCTFYAPEKGSYIETYLSVAGNSVTYIPIKDDKIQASIEISITLKQGDAIKYFDKYNLLSPEETPENALKFNFLDQQRISLPNGTYKMDLNIRDKNSDDKAYSLEQNIKLEYYPNIISISDIELLEDFSKSEDQNNPLNRSGYKLVPLVDNFYGDAMNNFKFYAEIYNTQEVLNNDSYLLSYHIENNETHQILESYKRFTKQQAKPVNILLTEYDMQNVPPGNYKLVMEVRNRNNELLATRELFFQRSQSMPIAEAGTTDFRKADVSNTFVASITNKDSLADYIKSLRPISGANENAFADNQLAIADLKMMQQFFYDFWQRRNPDNPYMAWTTYKAEVEKVNAKYSAFKHKGYDTDQGRVYLQYGPPNSISENYNEPNTYPYEIWHYYAIKSQSNRKFVFYNPDLVSKSFTLLHSDAIGEPNEPQWQMMLYKRTVQNSDFDQQDVHQGFGQHSQEQFKNPH